MGSFGCTRLSAADIFGTIRRPHWLRSVVACSADIFGTIRRPHWLRSVVARSANWLREPRDVISCCLASFGHFHAIFSLVRTRLSSALMNSSSRRASQITIARRAGIGLRNLTIRTGTTGMRRSPGLALKARIRWHPVHPLDQMRREPRRSLCDTIKSSKGFPPWSLEMRKLDELP